ncbi:MAG: DUF6516 family protein [Ignavibacteriaceae bacterium]
MISIIEAFAEIIDSYEIHRYRQYGKAYEFVAVVRFNNESELYIKDYLFLNGERKYSFHWQNKQNQLIRRWDNSPYHKNIKTFPFHLHTANNIEDSKPITLKKVLEFITKQIH